VKKLLSGIVALILTLTLAPAAFAEETLTDAEIKAKRIINLFTASTEREYLPGEKQGTWLAMTDYFAEIIENDPAAYDEILAIWMDSVDKYSYITPEASFDAAYDPRRTKKVGVSVEFKEDDGWYVILAEKNSPAQIAGVVVGTKMLEFHGTPMPMDAETGFALMDKKMAETGLYAFKGQLPDGTVKEFSLTPADYDLEADAAECKVTGNTGYIRIHTFTEDADRKFAAAWKSAEEQGVRSVIIDVRDNLGGYIHICMNILNTIISEKLPVEYFQTQNGIDLYATSGTGSKTFRPDIVILTNEASASAPETLTAVLKHYGYARSVGAKTYGKAVGQANTSLKDGYMFAVTAMMFYLPDGSTYNLEGIAPDVEIKDDPETEADEVLEFAYSYVDNAGTPVKQPSNLHYTINLSKKDEKIPLSYFAAAKRLSDEMGMPVYYTFKAEDGTKVTVDAVKVFSQAKEEYSFEGLLK
jgi:carboxyl-terminal processing protease